MGILVRSAIVIGVLVYLTPLRTETPADKQAGERTSSIPALSGAALSGAADHLWQKLPETARKTVAEEAKWQILNEVRRALAPETQPPQAAAPPHEPRRPIPHSARKQP